MVRRLRPSAPYCPPNKPEKAVAPETLILCFLDARVTYLTFLV
jgi:hypothetical protein